MLEEVAAGLLSRLTEVSIDSGDATGGSLTTIVDTIKNWGTDMWKDAIVEVEVDDVHYYRTVTTNDATTLTVATLPVGHPVAAGDHYNIRLSTRIVTISGQAVKISGEVVHISGQAVKVSGQTITQASGAVVLVSGQTITQAPGAVVLVSGQTIIAEVSGQVVQISGQAVNVSGATVIGKISGETVVTSISGNVIGISGQTVIAKISGEIVTAKVSGETVVTSISGNVIRVSGETVTIQTPTMLKTGPVRTLPNGSGGVVLHSGNIKAAVVKALTDNSGIVLVGGSGDRPWYESVGSAQGLILAAGEAQSKDVNDFSAIYVVAQVSGDKVCFEGVN